MPRGPAPEWKRRKEPILDAWLIASVQQAGGKYHPDTGHYATLVIDGLADRNQAKEYVRALHRCAQYLCRWGIADIGVNPKIERGAGGFQIKFAAVDKTSSRAYVLQRYGSDRSKWPYDPRRRNVPNVESRLPLRRDARADRRVRAVAGTLAGCHEA